MGILESFHQRGHILQAAAQRTELKHGLGSIGTRLISKQSIRITLLGALEIVVLEMHQRCTAGIFAQIIGGVLAKILNPAEVKLALQLIGGGVGINVVKPISAVLQSLEFEVVVVVEQSHSGGLHLLCNLRH